MSKQGFIEIEENNSTPLPGGLIKKITVQKRIVLVTIEAEDGDDYIVSYQSGLMSIVAYKRVNKKDVILKEMN